MRRSGLIRVSSAGLIGMASVLAMATVAPSSARATGQGATTTPSAAAAAPAAKEPAPTAGTAPGTATGTVPAATATPVAAPAAGAPAASQPTPVKPTVVNAPAPLPRALQQEQATGGGAAVRYSRRQRTAGAGAAGAEPAAPANPAAAAIEITCQAGCNDRPGLVVHVQEVPAPPAAAAATAATSTASGTAAKAGPAEIVCLAGCYGGSTSFAGVPSTEAGYLTTGGKLPKAATSGEWLVKINRERGVAPTK